MSHLPQVTGDRLIRALQRAGFAKIHTRGSHAVLVHPDDPSRRAVVPVHGSHVIKPGTLRAILRGVQLTVDELKDLL